MAAVGMHQSPMVKEPTNAAAPLAARAAQDKKILHRDLKSQNVFLVPERVRVTKVRACVRAYMAARVTDVVA